MPKSKQLTIKIENKWVLQFLETIQKTNFIYLTDLVIFQLIVINFENVRRKKA